MKAVLIEAFGRVPTVCTVPDPSPSPRGVVLRVEASGLCRSDYHGWVGQDPSIALPHVPGHEMAGTVVAVGTEVRNWRYGARVTVPFVTGCGSCAQCSDGQQHICDAQSLPGFSQWGSFAEYVAIDYADVNLVALPDEITFVTAASLGCRFITSFRAVAERSGIEAGQWLAVHGCGGIGLSAIMIGQALGARVIGVDIASENLDLARALGAEAVVDATAGDPAEAIHDLTGGGAHASIDALGAQVTCWNSVCSLRKRGRHVQVGWTSDADPPKLPMERVMGWELEILGSQGMQAHQYPRMMEMIARGRLAPEQLIRSEISLTEAAKALAEFNTLNHAGMTVISEFASPDP